VSIAGLVAVVLTLKRLKSRQSVQGKLRTNLPDHSGKDETI
jgi:hypothetical protein